jgi:hypothetical protein
MYYLRTKPAVNAIQYTVDNRSTATSDDIVSSETENLDDTYSDETICLSCQA